MAGPSGVTPRLALPYPIPDDGVDVPRDMQALATKLDGSVGVIDKTYSDNGAEDGLLPATAPEGAVASLRFNLLGGVPLVLVRFDLASGVWICYPSAPAAENDAPSVASGSGWRKTALEMSFSMRGQYLMQATAELTYPGAESTGGIGLASQATAAGVAPGIIGTQGQGTANYRTMVWTQIVRANASDIGVNNTWSLRVNTAANHQPTILRAAIYAWPYYVYGV